MPEWRWLLWYYGRALELPFPVLLALCYGETLEQVTSSPGRIEVLLNGKRHCRYGPAVIVIDGLSTTRLWWLNGILHRDDGPACEWADGSRWWYRNGLRHRQGGPACEEADGRKEWYVNDRLHRVGGPAVEYADGTVEYWHHGVRSETAQNSLPST